MLSDDQENVMVLAPGCANLFLCFLAEPEGWTMIMDDPCFAVSDCIHSFRRVQRFAERCIDMDRAVQSLKAEIDRFIDDAIDRPDTVLMVIVLWQLKKTLYMLAENLVLVNRLSIVLGDPFSGSVRSDHDEGSVAEVCFSHCRRKVRYRRARRADDYDRRAK